MSAYTLTQVKSRIFLLSFPDHYDLAMHFLRYQEFYESPNPDINGKPFTIIDFMEWYSKSYGNGMFSYADDWAGFNIPSWALEKATQRDNIPDFNKYDFVMKAIYLDIKHQLNGQDFYLIGADADKIDTIQHEVAHGMFFTNPEYCSEMLKLVQGIENKHYTVIKQHLVNSMYSDNVIDDEIQAYFSTGLSDSFRRDLIKGKVPYKKLMKPFKILFEKYYAINN